MRVRPINFAQRVSRPEPCTPTLRAVETVRDSAHASSERTKYAKQFHTEQLERRLASQYRVAAGLGVLTLLSVVASLGLSIGAGPVVLAALWVIPSGLAGSLVSQLVEIENTRTEIRRSRASTGEPCIRG